MGAPFCFGCEILIWVAGGDRDKKPANAVTCFLLCMVTGVRAGRIAVDSMEMNKERRKRWNVF
jgi:hypothetical protein